MLLRYSLLIALFISCGGAAKAFSPQIGSKNSQLQHHHPTTRSINTNQIMMSAQTNNEITRDPIPNENIFFIEIGFGNDSHGQSATKAAVRACRNAIEFNSIPSIQRLIPDGGYDALKLDVLLAVPPKYRQGLDLDEVAKVFPYGHVRFEVQDGGMVAPSGIAIEKLGDDGDDMVVVCASVTVGH
mmetsp:Transcript_20832/g.29838  ORF Transcript_20832/g.29838 Transcript_20832/m.29838 type:complete len:185 (+) Transcript_20832:108-662(+)